MYTAAWNETTSRREKSKARARATRSTDEDEKRKIHWRHCWGWWEINRSQIYTQTTDIDIPVNDTVKGQCSGGRWPVWPLQTATPQYWLIGVHNQATHQSVTNWPTWQRAYRKIWGFASSDKTDWTLSSVNAHCTWDFADVRPLPPNRGNRPISVPCVCRPSSDHRPNRTEQVTKTA